MKDVISIYNSKNSFFAKKTNLLSTVDYLIQKIDIAIVIPACNENPTLFESLHSINNSFLSATTENQTIPVVGYIVVVNNKKSSSIEVKENNRDLIHNLNNFSFSNCPVITINLTKDGNEIPEKQGVGYARKYGMDFALLCKATIIACMDADTLVCDNYGKELVAFYNKCLLAKEEKSPIPVGAVTHFDHQKNGDAQIEKISRDYEKYMRTHSTKLKETGTPFWLWALGPTIVSSSYGYAGSSGMNKRIAGEDFYFLQSLVKLHIQQKNNGFSKDDIRKALAFPILDCTVSPQSRYSDRVLFGTGKKLMDVKHGKDTIQNYDKILYANIKSFLDAFVITKGNPEFLQKKTAMELPAIYQFLNNEDFFSMWKVLYRQNKESDKRIFSAFHSWFDGLKILRLFHVLSQTKDT